MLTKRQKEILEYMKLYSKKHEYAPSMEEVQRKFGLSSVSTVHQHINSLTKKGYLKKVKNKARGSIIINTDIENKIDSNGPQQEERKIKPLKKAPTNVLLCGDVIETLKKFPENSIDCVIADPPYNLSKGSEIKFKNAGLAGFGGEWSKVMEEWDAMPLTEYIRFTFEWIQEIKRVLKPTGSMWIFGTYHNIGLINTVLQMQEIEIINEVIWYKRNAFPNLAGRRLTASHETMIWAHSGGTKREYYFDYEASKEFYDESDKLKSAGKQMRTVWDIPNNKKKEELAFGKHPTQKPIRVCKRMIEISSKPGDLVLAPFSGAGSECVAAKELGRKYIGIDTEKKYNDIAKKRLSEIKKKL